MTIEKIKDPRTRREVTFVVGKIEGVYFNALKNIKTYSGPNGPWTPTHNVSIVVDGTRIGFGLTEKDAINSQDADGNYHKLDRGMEVSVEITEQEEYEGKTQYKSKASKVTVLDATAEAPAQTSGAKAYTKKDMSGVHTGHAINVAMNILGDVEDVQAIIETAKKAHTLTTKLKMEYQTNNPDMSEYDVGAMVGQSVLSASHYVEAVEDIEGIARQTLDEVVPAVSEYVKEASKESKKPAVVKKTVAKKTAKKTTKKALVVEDESNVDDPDIPESAFEDDDDVPFN